MIFGYKSECIICGKRGFRMNENNEIYCKNHWKNMLENKMSTKQISNPDKYMEK